MIVVFADMEEKTFSIYTDKGRTSIGFVQADILRKIIGFEDVLYVTSATYTTAENLIQLAESVLVENLGGDVGPYYIHSMKPGCLYLSDLDVSFNGPEDFKMLEDLGVEDINQSPVLAKLLRDGNIEIVSGARAKIMQQKYASQKNALEQHYEAERQRRKSGEQTRTSDGQMVSSEDGSISVDALPIDLNKRGGGASAENEARMLPEDLLP